MYDRMISSKQFCSFTKTINEKWTDTLHHYLSQVCLCNYEIYVTLKYPGSYQMRFKRELRKKKIVAEFANQLISKVHTYLRIQREMIFRCPHQRFFSDFTAVAIRPVGAGSWYRYRYHLDFFLALVYGLMNKFAPYYIR